MTDSKQLLAEYVGTGSEAAFRELVDRYLDMVYSTALRLVGGDIHRAQDVAQMVFADLARSARTFSPGVMPGGWLHRHTCFVAANVLRTERRRQLRERRAVEMNSLNEQPDEFSRIAPALDEAINELPEADRTAILLRFFEESDFRSVGEALGGSEDAARMRVTRALEKLESLLKRRGIATSAAAISAGLLSNAVQAAPAALGVALSATGAVAGTAAATTATMTKAIAMTTLQKSIVGGVLAAAVGTGIYEAHRSSNLHDEIQILEQQQASLSARIQGLQRERDDALDRASGLAGEITELRNRPSEMLRLRGEITRLTAERGTNGPVEKEAQAWIDRVNQLKQHVARNPGGTIPEFQFLTEREWLAVADAGLDTELFESDDDYRRAMEGLRFQAQSRFGNLVQAALNKYSESNGGAFPEILEQLQNYCDPAVMNLLLQLYTIKPATILPETVLNRLRPKPEWVITRKQRVNRNSTSRQAVFVYGNAYWQSPLGQEDL